jgi:hypothetical protein
MIGPHELSGYYVDCTKDKLGLTLEGASASDLCHGGLRRDKLGCDSVGGVGFLIAGIEIQETFPKKPTRGCVIDTERER